MAAAKAHNGIREDPSSAHPLRAFCSRHLQRRPHRGHPPASPASPPPWVCPAAGPLPACGGHPPPTFQLVALRLERRQEEEGDRAGRREAGRSPPGSFPLSSGIFFLSFSLLCPGPVFWQCAGFPPLVIRTLKVAVPTHPGSPGGCLCPAVWRQSPASLGAVSGVTAQVLLSPTLSPYYRTQSLFITFREIRYFIERTCLRLDVFTWEGWRAPGAAPLPLEAPQTWGCCCQIFLPRRRRWDPRMWPGGHRASENCCIGTDN